MKKLLLILFLLALPASAQISFFGASAAMAADASADISPALPASTLADDIILVHCYSGSIADTTTVAGYTEFGQIDTNDGTTDFSHRWFWKRHDGSETDPVCDHSTATNHFGCAYVFRGVVTTGNPWNALGTAEKSTTEPVALTGITTLTAGSMVVMIGSYEDNDAASVIVTATDPAAFTELYDESIVGADGSVQMAYALRTAAGATGTITVDFDVSLGTNKQFAGIVLSLEPAGAAPAAARRRITISD